MKILIVCQHYFPEQFRINDIAEEMVRQGHEITVLTGKPNYPEGKIKKGYLIGKKVEIINGVKVIRCPIIPRRKSKIFMLLNYISYVVTASIKSCFLESDFDVVYVYQLNPVTMAIPALFIKKIKKINVHLYCLDIWPEAVSSRGMDEDSLFFKTAYWLSKKIYGGVNSISVTSQLFIDYFKEYYPNLSVPSYIPQHAEDIFSIEEVIKHEVFTFCFAGNIGNLQSVETIIKAAYFLKDKIEDDFLVLIVGDGVAKENCEQLVKKLGIADRVTFVGNKPLTQMPEYYRAADAMLLTLINNEKIAYTLPGKTQSYMAMGKPIVAAISGEAKLVIEESDCGWVSPPEDSELLSLNMLKCMSSNQELLNSKGKNGYKYYLNHFTKEKFMDKTLSELKKLKRV
ncbi:glycosyltransferase family 4 protein [Enterococcus dispar]|uniref:glycosyltransferase family 4 protein n=1 Tax=Enterococcus dispar TaxID=44009 RepID=UPI00288DDAE9|nr:glycosyltransferase family 4 protein [Enterococcus dispar]MDT2706169.1 glycosyltransferase family 4 protein [Enterococcus dispar]